jgi:hypothetical protein
VQLAGSMVMPTAKKGRHGGTGAALSGPTITRAT